MTVITVFNQKGGVGKTTTCVNLTAALARMERKPLAIDLDSQAHLTLSLGLAGIPGKDSIAGFFRDDRSLEDLITTARGGLKVIPSHLELAKIDALFGSNKSIAGKLRAGVRESFPMNGTPILIDCCPTMGVLTLNAVLAADRILIPVSADYLSLQGVHRLDAALEALEKSLKRKFPRKVVVTRFDSRRKLSYEIYDKVGQHVGDMLCSTCITENVSLAEGPSHGMDVFSYAPHSQGAKDYQLLAEELLGQGFFD
ncbi:MAG: ParA family protein [Proteobacteria bacterium]|nr:ParA family protein [Pseudomonadota bacterium]